MNTNNANAKVITKKKFCEDYAKYSNKVLAKMYGTDPATITRQAKRLGLPAKKSSGRPAKFKIEG